jgi:beta-galactosidase
VDGVTGGPRLALWRAPTDNDVIGGAAARWADLGLDRLAGELVEVREEAGETVVVHRCRTGAGYVVHEQRFSMAAGGDGAGPPVWRCQDLVVLPEGLSDLPRIGVTLETAPGLTTAEWFGHGPWETYPDRRTAPVAWHRRALDALATPYVRPQENGGRAGVRRLELTGPDWGLRVRFERPAQVSVLRVGAGDLAAADRPESLRPRPGAVLHLDHAHRGLGTASCGPDTLPPYRTAPGVHTWTWWLETWGTPPLPN